MNIREITEKYDLELQKYADIVFPKFNKYLEKERSPYNGIIKILFDFYLFTSFIIDVKIDNKKKKDNPIFIIYRAYAQIKFNA